MSAPSRSRFRVAIKRSFQVKRNVMTALPMPGAMSGLTICTRMRSVPAPSIKAEFLDLFRQVLDEAHRQPDRNRKLQGEKAEAQEATELLYARVVLPATLLFGGADGEPDLVADGCAINGLKHQFEREALLHLADHDEFG